MYDYLIVGAGLYGATFANLAKKNGKKVLVIDKRNHIGGNVYTEKISGITVHKYGAHIFHTSNEKLYNFIKGMVDIKNFVNEPLAIYKNEVYNLPFNMNTFSRLFGVITPDEAKAKIAEVTEKYKKACPENLEEQALSLVGKEIYEKLIKGYTTKQWGRDCSKLPASIIKRIPLRYTYNNNYFNDKYQFIANDYTKLVDNLLRGIEVKLGVDFLENIKLKDIAEKIVYTGKIDEYYKYIYGKLEYRSLRFEISELEKKDFQGNAVCNYTSLEEEYTRIIEHKHFLKEDTSTTVITKEYPAEYNEYNEAYYPINDEKNNALYKKYIDISNEKVIFGGRLGLYQYLNMDQTMEKAFELARKEGFTVE